MQIFHLLPLSLLATSALALPIAQAPSSVATPNCAALNAITASSGELTKIPDKVGAALGCAAEQLQIRDVALPSFDEITAEINQAVADIEAIVNSLTKADSEKLQSDIQKLLDDLEADLKSLLQALGLEDLVPTSGLPSLTRRAGYQLPDDISKPVKKLVDDVEAVVNSLLDADTGKFQMDLQTLLDDLTTDLKAILSAIGLQQPTALATRDLPEDLTDSINTIVADVEAVVHSLTTANATDVEDSVQKLLDDLETELKDLLDSLLDPNATSSLLPRDGLELPANLTTPLNKIVADVEAIVHSLTEADSTSLKAELQTLLDDIKALLNGNPLQKRDNYGFDVDSFKVEVTQISTDIQTIVADLPSADAQKIESDVEQLVSDIETLVQAFSSVQQRDVAPTANLTTQIQQIVTDIAALVNSLIDLDSTTAQAKLQNLLDDLKALLQLPAVPGASSTPSVRSIAKRSSLPAAEAKLEASFNQIVADVKAFFDDFTSADVTQAEADFESFVKDVTALFDASQY